ncbi:DeoR family transcriptional regulator [Lysinibacillus sphaericus]|uniref:DeoR family transcriptional regulator n=1 Tax=Lysinibacillus sphaericus TaxID=1421 RepID=UPI000C1A755A|nr:DeoR family transcriptional regulator [Lysinibacillus sphaericus]PIJ96186.1 DeoR family transcriptional regulator [Lysinibacillus sphaericus]QTB25245.1 DeoR family transcriptional regulator [Lysinibacillus sphaericus]
MEKILIARVKSQDVPLTGQKNRSSGNFSTLVLPENTKSLKWEIEDGDDYTFNVMQDVCAGTDPVIYSNVMSGNRTEVNSQTSLYIANPDGPNGTFLVNVYAII